MFAVWKLNEEGIVLILFAKEDLCNWAAIIAVTNSTDAWLLSTQTATDMAAASTQHDSVARFITSWPVAKLSTQLGTLVMTTLPRAHLTTQFTQLAARFLAIAVHASVFAFPGTWWTRHDARLFTLVRTNQQTTTLGPASFVNSPHSALSASSRTLVTTNQIRRARYWAIFWRGRAGDSHIVSTWPLSPLHKLLAFFCARFSTMVSTPMTTLGKLFLTLYLALYSVYVPATSHCVSVSTQRQCFLHHNWTIRLTLLETKLLAQVRTAFDGSTTRFSTSVIQVLNVIRMA